MPRRPPSFDRSRGSSVPDPGIFGTVLPRVQARPAVLGGVLWWVGGRTATGAPRSRVERITPHGVDVGPSLPRDWHPGAVVRLGEALWAIGGTRRPHEPVATVRILQGDDWGPGPRLPQPVRDAGVVAWADGILVAGGLGLGAAFGPSEWRREAWWLDGSEADPRWRAVARVPEPRAGGRLLRGPEGHAVWVGGRSPEGEVDTALVWDRGADRWDVRPCGPRGLGARGAATLHDGTVVLVGGHRTVRDVSPRRFGPDDHRVVTRCHRVDVLTGVVTPLPDLPVARRHPTVIPDGPSSVLVVGGQTNGRRPSRFEASDDVDRIDVGAWAITSLSPLRVPRRGPGVACFGAWVAVVGGLADDQPLASAELVERTGCGANSARTD